MLQRFYVNKFRCLENFDFKLDGQPSSLLIGKNGSGKSTLRAALKVLQSIGRGVTRISDLVEPGDFTLNHSGVPMRFELEAQLNGKLFSYVLALELPDGFRELRVREESLDVGECKFFSRNRATVTVYRNQSAHSSESQFNMDWHMVALPIIQDPEAASATFSNWLAKMVLLAPIPKLMSGKVTSGTVRPDEDVTNWADWLSGLLDRYPAAYQTISKYLEQVMPDLESFRFDHQQKGVKDLFVRFSQDQVICELPAGTLSDGEKCFFLCAVVLAANEFDGPLFIYWDEPDSHLSLDEVSQFVISLRRGFSQRGQILVTSHNPEAIRRFSDDSTWVFGRRSHLEPVIVRRLQELAPASDLIQELIDGGLESWV